MKKNAFFGLLVFLLTFGFTGCDTNNGNDEEFVSSTNETISNDISSLGLIGTSAISSNENVATVVISSGKIKITSVGNGSAVITVSENIKNATIDITVSNTGSIKIGTITKYIEQIKNPFIGTWISNETGFRGFDVYLIYKFTDTEWELSDDKNAWEPFGGTYTWSDNTASLYLEGYSGDEHTFTVDENTTSAYSKIGDQIKVFTKYEI